MVALEAMERARPVIAAAIGGLGELVEDGETGLLVAPGDSEPLTRAIVELGVEPGAGARDGASPAARGRSSASSRTAARDRTELLYRSSARARAACRRPASARPSARRRTPRARARARRAPSAARLAAGCGRPQRASAAGSSGGTSRPVSPSRDDLRDRADAGRHHRQSGEHRLEQREAEPLPASGVNEQRPRAGTSRRRRRPGRADEPRRRRRARCASRSRRSRSGPSPRTTSTTLGCSAAAPRGHAPRRPGPSAAVEARHREQHASVRPAGRSSARPAQAGGQRVEPVVDDRRACRRAGRPARAGTARASSVMQITRAARRVSARST